jgi:hypothetical protein
VTFDDPSAVDTTASFDAPGTYVLRLEADDNDLAASDTVTVVVSAPAPDGDADIDGDADVDSDADSDVDADGDGDADADRDAGPVDDPVTGGCECSAARAGAPRAAPRWFRAVLGA